MSFNKELYFCSHCKKILPELEDLLFVEDGSNRGFCSEKCIEEFFMPLVIHFESLENKLRKKLEITNEKCLNALSKPAYLDRVLTKPSEVWRLENELKEEIFSFIGHLEEPEFGKFSIICLCFVFSGQVSFVFLGTATSSDELINEFRIGEKVENIKDFLNASHVGTNSESSNPSSEMLIEVERKKGNYLADLLEKRSVADIPFESFPLYDQYLEVTLAEPDEVLVEKDDDGDQIYTYIKACDREGVSFFYFVLLVKDTMSANVDDEFLIPIISFPTVDGQLYNLYKNGELLSGGLKN